MTDLIHVIQAAAAEGIQALYQKEIAPADIVIQDTKKEFEGDFTLVTFALSRLRVGAPPQIAESLGGYLQENLAIVDRYNVIKGFLNLVLTEGAWLQFLGAASTSAHHQLPDGQGQTVVVEYCSPNTNKPLHLGHLRNIILGYSLTQVFAANGYKAIPTCLFNDRGTNISKSMWSYLQAGKMDTPETAGVKGDKLVADYYVAYGKQHQAEVKRLVEAEGNSEREAEQKAYTTQAINELTIKWEANDPDTRALWQQMNGWVYTSMKETFRRLGVEFDKFYYESAVYLKGKETVAEGLEKGTFYQDEEGTVWIDLTEDKLDKKVLLRSNGTSLYLTQDLAIAAEKFSDYHMNKSIYVVGNEQEYHFKVLFKILEKLEKPYAEGLFHLSYGMVNLPSGKMKTREGTVVEADDLMDEMYAIAKQTTEELGKTEGMDEAALDTLYRQISLAALKYFLVKVDPKKDMLFNPAESVDIHGNTGPFIQYAYTRTAAIRRKSAEADLTLSFDPAQALEESLLDSERVLLKLLYKYPTVLREAAATYNPALIANYSYELAKEYNRFYGEAKVLQSDKPATSAFRFHLNTFVGETLKASVTMLGIEMPERM